MFMVILLAALSILAIATTIAALHKDGYRRIPTDWSRIPDRSNHDSTPAGQTMWQVDAGWGNRPANDRPSADGMVEIRAQAASTR